MRWPSGAASGIRCPATIMITNTCKNVRESVPVAGPEAGAACAKKEVYIGIDAAAAKHTMDAKRARRIGLNLLDEGH